MELKRQHLIDPAICIRCNTCQEICPKKAISNNVKNYLVDPALCNFCLACVSPCPTGAIDNWFMVADYYPLAEQMEWFDLPERQTAGNDAADAGQAPAPAEVSQMMDQATSATGGRVPPPWSAAHPYTNLYGRDRPATARVAGNFRITGEGADSDIRHIVLDFGQQAFPVLEGQSIGILPPGTDAQGRPFNIRLYSVASPREGERPNHNNLALTIKRVADGVGSNYICDRVKGDEVQVTGPFGDSFLMPNHPEANIIMVCTGTGSAPFRAFTERRRRKPPVEGKLMLFFGARSSEELPYFGPLMKLPKSLIDVNLAFSRVPGQPKVYVQDKIRERAADVAQLLKSDNTFVYICGLKGMEQGCDEAFADLCRGHDLDWASLCGQMRREGRYHVETY